MLKSFLGPFAITFPVALFVLDMQILWVYADDFIGKGLDTWIILQLMWYASARIVNQALPLAILVASIMAMGNLSEKNELTALRSAGIPLMRILKPLVILMMFISCGALWFSSSAWPSANLKFRALLYSVTKQRPALNIKPGIFYTGIEGFSIRVENKEIDGTLNNILIYDHRDPERQASLVIKAESGKMYHDENRDELVIELNNGHSYEDQKEKKLKRKERLHPHVMSSFEHQILRINLRSLKFDLADENLFRKSYEMMSLPNLKKAIDSLQLQSDNIRKELVEYGINSITPFKNKLFINKKDSGSFQEWFSTLSKQDRNTIIASSKQITRNQARSIENYIDKIQGKILRRDRHTIEWHRKFILAISCLVLFFVGAPLGALIKKGGIGLPIVFAISIFLFYYIVSMVGEEMVKTGTLLPSLGMWFSTIILIPIASFLTYLAIKGGGRYIFTKAN